MSEWTDEAMDAWASYLDDVRRALSDAGAGGGDADVVIRDLEDHATQAFADANEPVTLAVMQRLIERLGPAAAIAGAASGGGSGAPASASAPDPEARRSAAVLAYGSLAALAAGVLAPAVLAGAVPLAFVLARVAIRFTDNERSTQRRLLYPALAVGSLGIAALLALWPFALVLPLAATGGLARPWLVEHGLRSALGTTPYWLTAWGTAAVAAGLWCAWLRLVARRRPALLSLLFHPFVSAPEHVSRIRRALRVLAASLMTLAAFAFILALW